MNVAFIFHKVMSGFQGFFVAHLAFSGTFTDLSHDLFGDSVLLKNIHHRAKRKTLVMRKTPRQEKNLSSQQTFQFVQ